MGYRDDYFDNNPSNHGWYTCVRCGRSFRKGDVDIDHIIPQSYGGPDHPANLQCMCKHCNRSKRDDLSDVPGDLVRNNTGCFITTAVCAADGKPDDCYELTTFRAFRDSWLANQPDGRSLIDKYYDIAPKIVDKINRLPDASKVYQSIRAEYLEPCLALIRQGKNIECKNLYVRMVESLQKSFLK